jgi:CBS domain-containing protein
MPVLSDENNKIVGIISISDLVKLYDNEVEKVMKLRHPSNQSIDLADNATNNYKDHNPKRIKAVVFCRRG